MFIFADPLDILGVLRHHVSQKKAGDGPPPKSERKTKVMKPKRGEVQVGDTLLCGGTPHKVVKVARGRLADRYRFEDANRMRGGDRWYDAWECKVARF